MIYDETYANFGGKLYACKSKIHAVIDKIASTQDLTVQEMVLLVGVYNQRIENISDVTRELGMKQANASTLCKNMEKKQYILRSKGIKDVRVVQVSLADIGKEKVENIITRFQSLRQKILNQNDIVVDFEVLKSSIIQFERILDLIELNW